MKKYWTLPLLVVMIGIAFLAFQNYQEASTPPSDSWSREAQIATSTVRSGLDGKQTDEGVRLAHFTDDALNLHTYDEGLNSTKEKSIPVQSTKGAEVFTGNTYSIYYAGGGLYRSDTEEQLARSEVFLPTENGVVYVEEQTARYMDGDTLETTIIAENVSDSSSLQAYDSEEGLVVSISEAEDNDIFTTVYQRNGEKISVLEEMDIELSPSLKMEEVYPLVQNGSAKLLVSAVPAFTRSSGEKSFFLTEEEGDGTPLVSISFPDPQVEGSSLQEVEDLLVFSKNGLPTFLFRAQGYTETKTGGTEAFNIYEGTTENGSLSITRLSNTPRLSVNPEMVNDGMVAWLDIGADTNTVFMAASDEHESFPAPAITGDTLLRTAGKTLSMLTTGLMTIFLTVLWYAPPLLLIGAWMFRRRNPFDDEKEWSFYVSVAFYTAVALLFHQHLFKSQVLAELPEFLGFPGSPFVLIIGFSLVAFGIVKVSGMEKWWSIPGRVAYFIGLHVLFMTVYVGPYLF
ncbi:DUF4870 domain-containing protein [Salimicrobium flavidum]|uniref:Uncharacterized protein n=1 Tax=Salimicrobium flavidum TaxID=570947 RepID=A0A1N7KEY5_9BACI|nr:DUF4870 domain-containing protein [Salimicrobium flavidum]SIS60127.1 hypothetical protein SAMN05421687_11112 [Salimicrobium flavidum]